MDAGGSGGVVLRWQEIGEKKNNPLTSHDAEIRKMKCPNCGSEAGPSATNCASCGRPVTKPAKVLKNETEAPSRSPSPNTGKGVPAKDGAGKFKHAEVAKKLKFDYAYGSKDSFEKALSSLEPLFAAYRKPKVKTHDLLELAANIVYRQLRIREVSIGLRDPKDGLYRYEVMAGMRAGIWQAHEDLAYTREDFSRNDKWSGTMISKYTKLMLAEDGPYEEGEMDTVDRQEMLASKRHSLEDSIEGDYMDVMIHGMNDELIGWIEISGTWSSKMPDPHTIRVVELVACTLGLMLSANPSLAANGKRRERNASAADGPAVKA